MQSNINPNVTLENQLFRSLIKDSLFDFLVEANFELILPDGSSLSLIEVVRIVPGKRLVCRCLWKKLNVYVKIFIGRHAKRHANRDAEGIAFLTKAGIKTPPLLLAIDLPNHSACILIFKEIVGLKNAEQAFLSNANIEQLMRMLVMEVALHHKSNIIQTDMYLKNFLVGESQVFTLDGDGIRQYRFLTKKLALMNLATLISKFDVLVVEKNLSELVDLYFSVRQIKLTDLTTIQHMVFYARTLQANSYANVKVFRQCTDVGVDHTSRRFLAASNVLRIDASLLNIRSMDRLMATQNLIKNGRTCTVARLNIDHNDVALKRYNIKSVWHAFNRAFRQTRAAASWSNAHRLKILGIPTPQPIGLIEQRFFGLRGKAYFLSEYLDAPDVKAYFATLKNKKQQNDTIRNIVNLFYRLHLLKLSHGDMKSSNIKVLDGIPWLIDLDSMRQHRFDYFALKAHVEDLRRFMLNWQDQSTLYNMFVKEFHMVYPDHKALRLAGLIH